MSGSPIKPMKTNLPPDIENQVVRRNFLMKPAHFSKLLFFIILFFMILFSFSGLLILINSVIEIYSGYQAGTPFKMEMLTFPALGLFFLIPPSILLILNIRRYKRESEIDHKIHDIFQKHATGELK